MGGAETAFVNLAVWDENDHTTPLSPPRKRKAFGALDLSSTTDLSAFGVITKCPHDETKVEFHLMLYTPEEGLVERERRDRLPYREWVKNGWLKLCKGNTIDQDMIKLDVYQAATDWDLKDVAYDRWNASKMVREMREDGLTMVEFGQGYASMSAPTKSLLTLVAEHKVMTGGNKALRTQIASTSAVTDAAGNIKPDKAKSSSRIDGVVTLIMSLDGLNRRGGEERRSAYEDDDFDDDDTQEEVEDTPMNTGFQVRRSAYEDDDE